MNNFLWFFIWYY